ncbi:PP2C family serine/threonine-protein phosphatase [Blastococcus sp. URHD0036]|uniref:PP2C family protein-serine/threonine phosphatase n=1 Tax=Blastococcus sp. URHD0036 TaxID=1380356 RepID=UPI00068D5D4C|nr:protein phosphatase 2C domain-containing protein [Blastococcus sp. URHD0036]
MPQVQLSWGSSTHIGQREENQDRLLAAPPVFAVADGMGGHAAGAEAAQKAVDCLSALGGRESLAVEELQEAVRQADDGIRALGEADPSMVGAGSTVAGVALVEDAGELMWAVFHVGDSRVYCWTPHAWGQVTVDHSLVQVLVDSGHVAPENAATHPQRNIVTRALGVGAGGDAAVTLLPLVERQRFLVCSDGLSNEVTDEWLGELLGGPRSPDVLAQQMVTEAAENGGRDNIAAVVVQVDGLVEDVAPFA